MATDLTAIFGNDISVGAQPRRATRQYTAFPGAQGLVGMHMGTRGRPMVVTGRLSASDGSYNAARQALQAIIDTIEAYLTADAADYDFKGQTYSNVVFDRLQLIPDNRGVFFHWTAEGKVTVNFVCFLTILV